MREYSATEVENLLKEGNEMNLIDVREIDEVKEGKIPNALHIPLGLLEFRVQDLDQNKEYIMVCRSGGRSGRAVQFLESRGFHAINMAGGMLEWKGEVE